MKTVLVERFNEKIPIDTLVSFKDDLLAILNGIYKQVPTIVIPLGNSSLAKYGVDNFVINFDWFEPYVNTIHNITGGFLWASYMLWLFFNIKSILNATSSGANMASPIETSDETSLIVR